MIIATGPYNLCFLQFQRCCPLSLAFTLVLHNIHSVVFLKPTVSIRPSVPPSGSHKCLRFGPWSTLCTLKCHWLTYLLIWSLFLAFNPPNCGANTKYWHCKCTYTAGTGCYCYWHWRFYELFCINALLHSPSMTQRKWLPSWRTTRCQKLMSSGLSSSSVVMCKYSTFWIESNSYLSFDLLRNQCNYLKFSNTYLNVIYTRKGLCLSKLCC